jgi:outer membrane receptor protein involved in Fe transport
VVADLDSEEILGFEAGYRASRDRHNYSLTAYWMDKENVVFQDSDRNNVSNGETRHKGVEFSGSFLLSDALTLSMVTNYARHTYEANVAPRGVTLVLDGKDIDTSPKLTASAQLAWQIAENHNMEFEWVKVGSYYTDEENLHEYEGHSLLNIRYQADFDQWYLGARLTNALDEDYAERADFAFGNDRYFVGEPASLYVTVGTRF